MMDEDLEKTKPITILKDLEENEEEVEEKLSRTQKNKDILEEEIDKEKEEEAEEALAEKNIAMAEALIEEEENEEETTDNEEIETLEPVKENIFTKLKNKWNSLDKKKKILFSIILALILVLIIAGIVLLVVVLNKNHKDDETNNGNPVEEVTVLADNFYYKDGKLYFLGDNEEEIGSYDCENKSSSLCYVGFNSLADTFDIPVLLDEKGKSKEERYPIIDDNYVYVVDNKEESDTTVKLYSIKDNKVLKEYKDVKVYDDNYAIVATDDKYGLIKLEDGITNVIEEQYDYLGMINGENNLIAKYNKGYKVIDKKNKSLSSNFSASSEIKTYNDNFVVAKIAGDYVVYDYKATLIDEGYDYITLNKDYMFLVKDDVLYVKDKDKNKLNEGNITLKNSDYVKTSIYNDDGQLVKTKVSFEVNIESNNVIQVYVYESGSNAPEVKYINLNEALVNAKYDYINYFDGTLYFYGDEEKEELLGTYKCMNPNEVASKDDDFTSCFLATDTIYEDNDMTKPEDMERVSRVPIINKKFVFIADGLNNIILYDLKAKKSLVDNGYTTVSSYTENNDNKVTLYEGNINIIALGKKGKYGMLSIEGENVTTQYYFNYNKMEKLGDYVLALNTSGKWKILFGDDNESVGFDNKIRGYNSSLSYYKVKNNDRYTVYDINGNQVSYDLFKYVELYGSYFAGVNSDSELYLYDYYGNKISNEGIKIGDYPYYGTTNPAFKVTRSGSNYIVSVYDGSIYTEHLVTPGGSVSYTPETEEE